MSDDHGTMDVIVDGKLVRRPVDFTVDARPVGCLPVFPMFMRPVLKDGEIFVQSFSGPGSIFRINYP